MPSQRLPAIPPPPRRRDRSPMHRADASAVRLAEKCRRGRILCTDERDFGACRRTSRKPFHNLLAAWARRRGRVR